MPARLPIIPLKGLTPEIVYNFDPRSSNPEDALVKDVSAKLSLACEKVGFYYISEFEHLLPDSLVQAMDKTARKFFELPEELKKQVGMEKSGASFRGYFGIGGELSNGLHDLKEGIFFGNEHADNFVDIPLADGRKRRQATPFPFHGKNLFPDAQVPEWRNIVLRYMSCCEQIGDLLMALIAVALELEPTYFKKQLIGAKPLGNFQCFHYPPKTFFDDKPKFKKSVESRQGVGSHNDYGCLTLLRQDDVGGLQVQDQEDPKKWNDIQPLPKTMVINLGDVIEGLTNSLYRSTPHRVVTPSDPNAQRISFPYFYDPAFFSILKPLPLNETILQRAKVAKKYREETGYVRWDCCGAGINFFNEKDGRKIFYGEHVIQLLSRSFPKLFKDFVLDTNQGLPAKL